MKDPVGFGMAIYFDMERLSLPIKQEVVWHCTGCLENVHQSLMSISPTVSDVWVALPSLSRLSTHTHGQTDEQTDGWTDTHMHKHT